MSAAMDEYYRNFGRWLNEEFIPTVTRPRLDPRDPDPSRPGIFRDHNCWKCKDGQKPCANGSPNRCEYPHARND